MANQLWLLRHGEAEPHGVREDAERRLTPRGEAQSRAAGKALRALTLTFQAVYTSPKVRARDTALLAAESLPEEPIVTPVLAEDFDVADARDLLLGVEPDGRILVVGHNPDFAQVVFDLTGARVDFKKGGVAGVRLDGSRGELIALLRPRELDAIVGEVDHERPAS
jgi:phosphohistidine phosphatase